MPVDLKLVSNFWDSEISLGNVVELVPDFFWQSRDEGANTEQLALVALPASNMSTWFSLFGSSWALQVAFWMEPLYFSFSPRLAMA